MPCQSHAEDGKKPKLPACDPVATAKWVSSLYPPKGGQARIQCRKCQSPAWPDGGTTMVRITDAAGKEWDVYFDRRIGLSPAPRPGEEVKNVSNLETIYLNAYPSEPGSILVIHQKRFRDLVLSGIDH
ncbi:MAG: hypothetical protein HN759_07830 [Akkermansiaceae bacterium]|nr:hypothetical protein [Akkermansiaceae bacterium]